MLALPPPIDTGVGQSAHDTPNVLTPIIRRKFGPWTITSPVPQFPHAKPIGG